MAELASLGETIEQENAAYAGLVTCDGRVLAMACRSPLLADVPSSVARRLRERYPPAGWSRDDVFITNDPYEGGVRLDVVSVFIPVFVKGEASALAGVGWRHADIGAMAESAFTYRREIRHEGFRLSLLRVKGEELPQLLSAMLLANVRLPEATLATLRAQLRAARAVAAEAADAGTIEARSSTRDHFLRNSGQRSGRGSAPLHRADGSGRISAELVFDGGRIRIALSADAAHAAADASAPLAATRAAVLTALEDVTGLPAWQLGDVVDLDLGGNALLHARYPGAVHRGGATAFAAYAAVLNALTDAGATPIRARSEDEFAFDSPKS